MDLSHITINFIKKDFGIKGEDNMEVNFIDMMKDSAENGTVYESSRGVEYKVANNTLYYKNDQGWRAFVGNLVYVTGLKFTKVEQYKEITAEEALKALREGKEIEFERYNQRMALSRINGVVNCKGLNTTVGDMFNVGLHGILSKESKFYIKE